MTGTLVPPADAYLKQSQVGPGKLVINEQSRQVEARSQAVQDLVLFPVRVADRQG